MKGKLIVLVGLIASIIGIVVFITGKQSLHDVVDPPKPYEVGLPPVPPDIQSDEPIPIIEAEEDGVPRDSSCSTFNGEIVIVVKAYQDSAKSEQTLSYELSGEDGVRRRYYMDGVSNADASWLDAIMIPGRRLRINGSVCGILTLTRVEMVPAAKR
jgi:hypothetical protein